MSRRSKWHPTPPPPPSPKILHFPRSRRTRRKQTKPATQHHQKYLSYKGNLESLFDQERNESVLEFLNFQSNSKTSSSGERREKVEEDECREYTKCGEEKCGEFEEEEEKWRFQAEILRAECNLLRMEREIALKKLQKNRVKMETTLASAVEKLLSGRKKIFEGKNVSAVLEEEIEDLAEKLEELQKSSRIRDSEVGNCNNFDKKASLVQRRLEKLGGLPDLHEYSIFDKESCKSTNEPIPHENKCSGRCKAIVRRLVEQVRAETEQWSQMQEMLGQVRGEMEELQASRDYWENRAHNLDSQIQSHRNAVEDWKEKALDYENKANELQLELSVLREEMQKSKVELKLKPGGENMVVHVDSPRVPVRAQLVKERDQWCWLNDEKGNNLPLEELNVEANKAPLSLGKQLAKEKRMLLRLSKENRHHSAAAGGSSKRELLEDGIRKAYSNNNNIAPKRSTLRDIGNSSPLH